MNSDVEKTIFQSHVRHAILGYLTRANGYTLNCKVLKSLLHGYGLIISGDDLKSELMWLEKETLVQLHESSDLGYPIAIARLTEKGDDTYIGAEKIDGVANICKDYKNTSHN